LIAHDAAEKRKRFSDYMSLTTSAVGQSGLDRIEAMLAATCGLTRPEYTEPLHQPLLLYLRGLRTVRWHDPREFAWSDVLEREFCSIREELDRVLKDGVFQPYLARSRRFEVCAAGKPAKEKRISTPDGMRISSTATENGSQ